MKYLPHLRTFILASGVFVSWSAVIVQFKSFLSIYGTLWYFTDCVVPNPLLTPCLWGSIAFFAAFVWSLALLLKPSERGNVWLGRLLLFGVCFAVVVLAYETVEFYDLADLGNTSVSCTPGVHPVKTSCFKGFLFFFASYMVGYLQVRSRAKQSTISQ